MSGKKHIKTILLLSAAALSAGLCVPAHADTTLSSGETLYSSGLDTAGTVTMNAASVRFASSGTWDNNFVLNSGEDTFYTQGYSATLSGDISGTGDLQVSTGLSGTDGGTLTLSGNNSYSGYTYITDGTLTAGSSTAISPNSIIAISDEGTLDLNGYDASVPAVFGSGSIKLGSGSLTITDSGSTNYEILDYAGVISGTGSLTLSAGTLYLTGENTYTGTTTIASGATLYLGRDGASGSVAGNITDNGALNFERTDSTIYAGNISGSGTVTFVSGTTILTGSSSYSGGTTIDSGATLQIGDGGTGGSVTGDIADSGTLIFDRSDSITYSDVISGTGSAEFADGATILTGTNSYTGGTTIDSGATLQLGNGGTTGSVSGDITDNGTLVFNHSDAITYSNVISGSGAVEIADGSVSITATNSYTGGTTIDSGATLQIGDGGTAGAISGDVADNGTLIFNRSDSVTFDGDISGSGDVTLSGGTLILTGTNSYTGKTSVASGATLQIGDGGTTGSITGDIVDNGALLFDRSGTLAYDGDISGTGTLSVDGGGTITLSGSNSYSGATTITDGTLKAGSDSAISSASAVTIADAGILNLAGHSATLYSLDGAGAVMLGSGTMTVANGGTYDGVISGTGGVNVTGGTLILNGANSYTGTTTITTGTLEVGDADHATATITGDVSVGESGTLTGHGTITGNVDNTSGGTVIPGGSIGTLTIDGNYTQGENSTLEIEVSPTESSVLNVSGTATLAGTLVLDLDDGSYADANYTLISADTVSGSFSTVTVTGASDNVLYSLSENASSVSLTTIDSEDGQIYSDLTTAVIDNAHTLNGMILDHASADENVGLNVWGRAFGGAGSYDGRHDSNPFSQRQAGVLLGADYLTSGNISYGLSIAFDTSALSVKNPSLYGHAHSKSYTIALNAGIPVLTKGLLSGDVFYSANDARVRRDSANTGQTAHPDSKLFGGALQMSYPFGNLTPQVRLSYIHTKRDGDTENGSGNGLAVASGSYSSFRTSVTLQYQHRYDLEEDMSLTPMAHIGIEGEMSGSGRAAKIRISDSTNGWVVPDYAKPDSAAALAGIGARLNIGSGTALFIRADGRGSNHVHEGMLSIGGALSF